MHFASITSFAIHFVSVHNFKGDGIYDVNPGYFQFVEQQL